MVKITFWLLHNLVVFINNVDKIGILETFLETVETWLYNRGKNEKVGWLFY